MSEKVQPRVVPSYFFKIGEELMSENSLLFFIHNNFNAYI